MPARLCHSWNFSSMIGCSSSVYYVAGFGIPIISEKMSSMKRSS